MKTLKKTLSILLSLMLLLSCLSAAVIAEADNVYATVYVPGQGNAAIYNEQGKTIYWGVSVVKPDNYINDMVSDCLPLFPKALLLNDWDEYKSMFFSYWYPMYEELRLDKNGEVTNGTYVQGNGNIYDRVPNYMLGSYYFYNDCA